MLDPKWDRAAYLINSTIAGIKQADALNARQRLRMRQSAQFPHRLDRVQGITYPYEYIRADPEMVANIGRYSFGGDNAQG